MVAFLTIPNMETVDSEPKKSDKDIADNLRK
jgi:hypothetical protein